MVARLGVFWLIDGRRQSPRRGATYQPGYIENQREHHQAMTFQGELRILLQHYGVVFGLSVCMIELLKSGAAASTGSTSWNCVSYFVITNQATAERTCDLCYRLAV